jgi:hypothetical protein
MARTLKGLQWVLLAVYAAAGALALMIATPAGLRVLGQSDGMVTFLPAMILGLPWSLPLWLFDDGPVTALAVLGICYALNIGVGLMLARSSRG